MIASPIALLPLLVFLLIFVGSGVYFSSQDVEYAFYQISPTVAILPAIILAFLLSKNKFTERLDNFLQGVRDPNIIIMCLIFLLAGGFSEVAKSIGSVEATVNWSLTIVSVDILLPSIFLLTAFMATAMGSSMGVIAAMGPLAMSLGQQAGLDSAWCMGAVVGGAMFGDNLSLVSDTTIASVNTQGANLKRKFLLNTIIAVPAMLITIVILYFVAEPSGDFVSHDYNFIKILPYIVILILALSGINVLVVLMVGIILAGTIGLGQIADYSLVTWAENIATGFASMQEILILSLLIGGLSFLSNKLGGQHFKPSYKNISRRIGEIRIAVIASLADICTANNTVAIILAGDTARQLAKKHQVTPERSACIIDIFSCVFQGLLPYSAQLLLAGSIAGISPVLLLQKVIYCPILGVVALVFILLQLRL